MKETGLTENQPQPLNAGTRMEITAGVIFLALYLAWIIWGAGSPFERIYAGGLVLVFTGAAAALQAWRVIGSLDPGTIRRAWIWIAAGLAVSAAGDLARFIDGAYFQPETAFGPITSWIYPAGTILLAAGISFYPRDLRISASRAMLLMDTFITTTSVVVLAWLMVFQPLTQAGGGGFSQGWGAILFAVIDLILLAFALDLFLLSDPRRVAGAYLWILAGLFAVTLSDLMYLSLKSTQGYQAGSLIDLVWVASYGCFILAGIIQLHSRNPQIERRAQSPVAVFQKLLPVLLVVILGWYSLIFWQFSGASNPLGLWVTVILGLGLIIRQGISTGEQQFIQYASLVNSISEPAFVCDREGRLKMVNPAFLRIAGFQQTQDALGMRLKRLLEDAESLPPFAQVRKEGWMGDHLLLSNTGERIPVSLSLQPIQPGGDDRLSLAGTAHDLREMKKQQKDLRDAYEQITRAHDALEEMNQQLAQKVAEETANLNHALKKLEKQNRELQKLDQLKSDFVSLVSHELRAPLTNINGGIELVLAQRSRLAERTRESLELVLGEINRLTRFVETILDISALDAGKMPLTIAPIPVSRVAETIQKQMTNLPDAERVRWEMPFPAPDVLADENALNSILFHLLDNAIKYAPKGWITVTAGSRGARGWLAVADDGEGIPEGAMPYLFDRFYRYNSKDDREIYGHGMGLYIVRRLLEAMKGSIEVHNLPQGGAQFTCWLPLAESERNSDAG